MEMDALVLYCPPMAAAAHTQRRSTPLCLGSAGQLALGTERMDRRPGGRPKVGPKEKGLHTGKLVQADDAMQERHVAEGCEQV